MQADRLTEIAQAQSEIIRVSSIAKDKGRSDQTRNFAVNTSFSVTSSQRDIKKALVGRGVGEKSINKRLTASKNPKTDALLNEATKNNRFDETFETIMTKQLSDYQILLQAAYQSSDATEKKTLEKAFQNAALLTDKKTANRPSGP